MIRPTRKFTGSFKQLNGIVAASGVSGVWQEMPAGYVRFVCETDGILNWWPSTGTLTFQGPAAAASQLEHALGDAWDRIRSEPRLLTFRRDG